MVRAAVRFWLASLCLCALPFDASANRGGADVCLSGLRDKAGRACCPASCGKCGGRGCHLRPGGAEECCGPSIERECADSSGPPPCFYRQTVEDYPEACFDAQFTYDRCCFDADAMHQCFPRMVLEAAWACCGTDDGHIPVAPPRTRLSGAEVACELLLNDPDREIARTVIGFGHDFMPTCLRLRAAAHDWPDDPIIVLAVTDNYLHLFDNFLSSLSAVTATAVQSQYLPLEEMIHKVVAFCFDGNSYDFCQTLAAELGGVEMRCMPPRKQSAQEKQQPVDSKSPVAVKEGGTYYAINWLKAAATQILLDLGSPAAMWFDTDIAFVQPLMRVLFAPLAYQLQVECEALQFVSTAPPEFHALGGIGFASRAASKSLARWLASYDPPDRKPEGMNEMYRLRELPSIYKCLDVLAFTRLPLPAEPLPPQSVTVHFWITGRMRDTLPASVTGHVEGKVYKMMERGMWQPSREWTGLVPEFGSSAADRQQDSWEK